jgi:hypothetical protein
MPWKQLLDFFSFFSRNKRVVFVIHPASSDPSAAKIESGDGQSL